MLRKNNFTGFAFVAIGLILPCVAVQASTQEFKVETQNYEWSRYFEITERDSTAALYAPRATVSRGRYSLLRTRYDMFSPEGVQLAHADTRIFSTGKLFTWLMHLDIYAPDKTRLGAIRGEVMTTAAARFGLYNEKLQRVAVAYMEQGGFRCVLTAGDNYNRRIGVMHRANASYLVDDELSGVYDPWSIELFDGGAIDSRTLALFAAFVADHQNNFIIK
jgi:hypothetical protein